MSFHSNHSDSAIHGEDEAAPQRQAPLPPQEEETAADQVIDPSLPITPASSEYHDESLPRSEEDADKKGEEESLKSDSDKVDNDGANFYYTNADEPDDKPFTAEELPQKESFTNPVFGAPHHPVNVFPADADDSEAFRRDSTSAATGYHASVVQTIQPQAEGLHTGSEEPSDHDSSAMVPLRDGSMPNLDPLHTQDEESDHSSAAELPEQEEWNNPTQIDEQQAPSIASSIHSSNNISNSPASSRPFSTVSAGLMRSHPNDLVQQAHSPITPATVGPMGTPLIVKADPFKADPFDSKEPQAAEYNNHVSPFDNEEENHPRGVNDAVPVETVVDSMPEHVMEEVETPEVQEQSNTQLQEDDPQEQEERAPEAHGGFHWGDDAPGAEVTPFRTEEDASDEKNDDHPYDAPNESHFHSGAPAMSEFISNTHPAVPEHDDPIFGDDQEEEEQPSTWGKVEFNSGAPAHVVMDVMPEQLMEENLVEEVNELDNSGMQEYDQEEESVPAAVETNTAREQDMEGDQVPVVDVKRADPLYEDEAEEELPTNDFQFSSGAPAEVVTDVMPEQPMEENPVEEVNELDNSGMQEYVQENEDEKPQLDAHTFSSGIPTAMEAAPIPEEHVEGADPLYEDEERPSNDFQFSSGVPAAADVAPEPQVVEEPIMEPHEEAFGANQQEEQDYNDFRFSSGAPERNVVAPNVEPVEPSGSDPIKPDTSNDEDGQTVNPNAASGFPIQSTYEPMDRTGESETFPGDYRSFSASVPGELRAASQLEMTNSHYFGSSTDGVEYNTKDRSSNSLDHVAASQNDVDPPTMPIYHQREEHPTEHTEVVVSTGEETREESARPEVNPEDEEMRKSFSAFVSKMRSQREASVNHANFRTYEEFSAEVTENMAKADNYFISMSDPRDGNFRPHQNSIFQFSYRFFTRNVYVQAVQFLLFLICWLMLVVQVFGGGGKTCWFTFVCTMLFMVDYVLLYLFQKMDRFTSGPQFVRLAEPVVLGLLFIFEIVGWSVWNGRRNGAFITFVFLRFILWTLHAYTRMEQLAYGLRCLCSADRRRYQAEGFDLDLAYIHRNIVAMAWPANNFERVFRNDASEVATFLDRKHPQSYLVINLCSERTYNPALFHQQTSWYPMDDHNPAELAMMLTFCRETSDFIAGDIFTRCLFIHCKGGKGRTGTLICALLLYMGVKRTADEALHHFAWLRTKYGSTKFQGVQAPSQERYVRYFEKLISSSYNMCISPRPLRITRLRVHNIPHLWYSQGIGKLYFVVLTKPCTERHVEFISNSDVTFSSEVPDPSTYTKKQLRDLFHDDEYNLYASSNVLDPNFANDNNGSGSAHGYKLDTESFVFYINNDTSRKISYNELHDIIRTHSATNAPAEQNGKQKEPSVSELNITLEFKYPERIPVLENDVVIKFFYARNNPNPLEAPVQVWFHTSMETSNDIFFQRDKVDGPAKDKKGKRYPMDFGIDVQVRPA